MSYNTRSKSRQIKLTEDRDDDFKDKPGIFEVKKSGNGKRGRPKKLKDIEEKIVNEIVNDVEKENEKFSDELLLETVEISECKFDLNDDLYFIDNEKGRAVNSTKIDEILLSMSEMEVNESIIMQDDIYDLIITEQNINNETYILETNGECDKETIGDETELYDKDNLDSLMNNFDLNVELNACFKFVKTIRNSRRLLYEGFSYVRDRGEFECIQWKCTHVLGVIFDENGKKKYKYCPGRVQTYNDRDLKSLQITKFIFQTLWNQNVYLLMIK